MGELLIELGKIAGVGGITLGVFLVLFKRIRLPIGTRKHLTLFMWLVWSFCIIGLSIYTFIEYAKQKRLTLPSDTRSKKEVPELFEIELFCHNPPPGPESSLARLFDFAEEHEGEIIKASIMSRDCQCTGKPANDGPIYLLEAYCERNPLWWGSNLELNCVRSLNLIAQDAAGVASFCYPTQESLPLRKGYQRSITAVKEYVSGEFIVYFEWNVGGPHVQLVIPEN